MSTAPNRLLRQWRARFGIRKRLRELTAELQREFPQLDGVVPSSHSGGFDSIYFLEDADRQRFGVLRLNNPHQKRKAVHTDLPRRSPAPAERVEREWQAYTTLAVEGLCPKPLWRSHDAVVCSYSPLPTFRRLMETQRVDLVPALLAIFHAVGRMHDAGIVHLDLSPGNVLVCRSTFQAVLIDFEYVPLPGRSFEDDCGYDWRQLIGRLQKRAAILGRLDEIEPAIAAAIEGCHHRDRIKMAFSESHAPERLTA